MRLFKRKKNADCNSVCDVRTELLESQEHNKEMFDEAKESNKKVIDTLRENHITITIYSTMGGKNKGVSS